MSCGRNYYQILEVYRQATSTEIKKAWHLVAQKYHPDKHPGASEREKAELTRKFIGCQQAYEVLNDEGKRATYNSFHSCTYVPTGDQPKPPPDAPKPGPDKVKGSDLFYSLNISWVEAVVGGERKIRVMRDETCTKCGGTGLSQLGGSVKCGYCGGSGLVNHPKNIVVKIPKRMDTGGKIKLRGLGHSGTGGGVHGDLYIEVTVSPREKVFLAKAARQGKASCHIFLVEQSDAMARPLLKQVSKTKAEAVADIVNRHMRELVLKSYESKIGCGDCYVGIVTYGDGIASPFEGRLTGKELSDLQELASSPLRVETRNKKVVGADGKVVEEAIKFPIWVEPEGKGNAPMCSAVLRAAQMAQTYCHGHPDGKPPVIINISSAMPGDGDPRKIAEQLKSIGCNDGRVFLANIHLADRPRKEIAFPDDSTTLPDDHARVLLDMSSRLSDGMSSSLRPLGYKTSADSRAFVYNARLETAIFVLQQLGK